MFMYVNCVSFQYVYMCSAGALPHQWYFVWLERVAELVWCLVRERSVLLWVISAFWWHMGGPGHVLWAVGRELFKRTDVFVDVRLGSGYSRWQTCSQVWRKESYIKCFVISAIVYVYAFVEKHDWYNNNSLFFHRVTQLLTI